MRNLIITFLVLVASQAASHSGGVNKQGCHSGSQPYHCHKAPQEAPSLASNKKVLSGAITHVRDGDTIEVNDIPISLAALDCHEKGTKKGD
jgi:endonuclease YncB( thermonuclease family)